MSALKRDKNFISSQLYEKDGKIYTKQKTIIEFPKWYENKELLDMQDITYLYGIFAIIIGDKYSLSVIPTLITTIPIIVKEIERDGTVYIQFVYGKDDCIIENKSVVKKNLLAYNLFENFFIYAKVPWFMEYDDLIKITDNILKYAKSDLGNNYVATELVSSFVARSQADRKVFYRQDPKGAIDYIDLINPQFSALSNTSKISGNYFRDGMVSALLNKTDAKPTKLEQLVRR